VTGKKNDSTNPQSDEAQPAPALSKAARERLAVELAYHDEAAAAIEGRTGQRDTYHHERGAAIRAQLSEVNNGELD